MECRVLAVLFLAPTRVLVTATVEAKDAADRPIGSTGTFVREGTASAAYA